MKSLCTRPDLDFVWCFFKQIEGPDAILWLAGRLELRPKLWMTRWFYIFLCSGFLSHNCGRCVGKEKTSKQALGWGYLCDLGKLQQIPSHRLTAAADISRVGPMKSSAIALQQCMTTGKPPLSHASLPKFILFVHQAGSYLSCCVSASPSTLSLQKGMCFSLAYVS